MLLQHGWLAELSKPTTISEEDEDEDAAEAHSSGEQTHHTSRGTEDEEVAAWVKNAIERKKSGLMGESQKPALHAAPLDSMSPSMTPG
jgi:mitogen-activated protein kinase kinase